MTDQQILEVALACGFKLKEQADGTMGLNPYVYSFARAALAAAPTPPIRNLSDCSVVCLASQDDGIICPHDSCDIEDGTRKVPTPPAQEASLPPDVINALRFYANGEHFTIDSDAQEFDTVSGEPVNWLWSQRDEDCTAIEDGSIARAVLQGKKIHGDAELQPVEGEVFHSTPAPEVEPRTARKWRERWYGSEPYRGSSIVDDAGELVAYFGGDEETHAAVSATVYTHNESTPPAPEVEPVAEELRIRIRDAIAKHLGDAMFCTRVWSAWSVGTMDQHDFVTVVDDESVLMDAVEDVLKEISPANDGLRKAAEELLMEIDHKQTLYAGNKYAENLRAELEKGS